MLQTLIHLSGGRLFITSDGRIAPAAQPEPEFLRRRYEHAQALREARSAERLERTLSRESQGFVERLRIALGLA
ncbi:MAG TPA: hypothetical protein PKI89_04460 [Tepidiformaceae bacterium]|nr:hypothetical protein [Tepidiformaceae bacterium]